MNFELGIARALAMTAVCVLAAPAGAQTWPERTVRVIVPFGPGGGASAIARVLIDQFNKNIGQKFVVENRAGAGATLGAALVASAKPDGYTLLISALEMAINPSLRPNLKYDPFKDFAMISVLVHQNYVLTCHPSVPAKTIKQLIVLAKAQPGVINFASSGTGGASHLMNELFAAKAGFKWTHIPYKGGGETIIATLTGEVDCAVGGGTVVEALVKAGKLRAVGVTGAKRHPDFPDVPSIGEAVPGYAVNGWYGLYAPAGTPPDIIRRLYNESKRALFSPEGEAMVRKLGNEPVVSTPEEFESMLRAEAAMWAKLIKDIGLKPLK